MYIMPYKDLMQLGVHERPMRFGFVKGRSSTDDDNIAKILNEPDPETGLPRDPVAIYNAKDTSSEVRQYIEQHYLMQQNNALGSSQSNDVSDDILLENVPDHNSTLNQFEDKVAKRLKEEKQKVEDAKIEKRYKAARKKSVDF